MSHLQFHFTCVLVLTLSWLNLRYKNMNTGITARLSIACCANGEKVGVFDVLVPGDVIA